MKTCTKCKEEKELSEFYKPPNQYRCISCARASIKEWSKANPEKRKAQKKLYMARHPEKAREKKRLYRIIKKERDAATKEKWEHPVLVKEIKNERERIRKAKIRACQLKWRKANVEALKERQRISYKKHSKKRKEYAARVYKENPEKFNKRQREWTVKNPEKVKAARVARWNAKSEKEKQDYKAKRANYNRVKYYLNHEKSKADGRKYYKENPEIAKAAWKKQGVKMVEEISDQYISHNLRMPLKNVPPEVIKAKRQIIQINRLLKQKQT
jgi:hypothetical protein